MPQIYIIFPIMAAIASEKCQDKDAVETHTLNLHHTFRKNYIKRTVPFLPNSGKITSKEPSLFYPIREKLHQKNRPYFTQFVILLVKYTVYGGK